MDLCMPKLAQGVKDQEGEIKMEEKLASFPGHSSGGVAWERG